MAAIAEGKGWRADAEVSGVLIGTPVHRTCEMRFLQAREATRQVLDAEFGGKIPVGWCDIVGESLVHRARNAIVAKAMADPRFSHLVFIDSDLEWNPRDVLRLIGHDRDVMCGIYPKKTMPPEFPFHPLTIDGSTSRRDPVTGAIEIAHGPTGFMCVQRHVFERMREAFPQLAYEAIGATAAEQAWTYAFFDTFLADGILWSEDYGFCRRWREIGGEVWCDPEIELGHVGTHVYRGSVASLWTGEGAVAAGTVLGWHVPPDDPYFEALIREDGGQPDQAVIEAALGAVRDFDGLAVDVGAHIGTWARPLGRRMRTIAVEPNAAMRPYLEKNVAGLPVEIASCAMWGLHRRLEMAAQGASNSGEVAYAEAATGPIRGMPLDDLVGGSGLSLLKVDVEGAELEVFNGALGSLVHCRPVVVVESGNGKSDPVQWLEGLGASEIFRRPLRPGHNVDNVVMAWRS